ncbi:unnamed protein product [Protopolystoma xenopodis]|uniref:Innexin n=1 Tax=Protopolystoma xenopodis TaxID=117903 RepID=A0A3S5AYL7_9PLAT|nr:unnamed protein product [Protopolystoma xenopodis]
MLDVIESKKLINFVGLEDFADRLSFQYSFVLLILVTFILGVKQYLLDGIACYMSPVPGGTPINTYMENYCWVHGTIPILNHEKMPEDEEGWLEMDKHRIGKRNHSSPDQMGTFSRHFA